MWHDRFLQYYNMKDELKYSWTNLHPISFLNSYTHYSPKWILRRAKKHLYKEKRNQRIHSCFKPVTCILIWKQGLFIKSIDRIFLCYFVLFRDGAIIENIIYRWSINLLCILKYIVLNIWFNGKLILFRLFQGFFLHLI